jgi:hypothetical protein
MDHLAEAVNDDDAVIGAEVDLDGSPCSSDLSEGLPSELRNHDVQPLIVDGKIRGAFLWGWQFYP